MGIAHVSYLVFLSVAGEQVEVETKVAPVAWTASAQLGMGQLDGGAAALLRPRLELGGSKARAVLSAPIWLDLIEHRLRNNGERQEQLRPRWLGRSHDPETYLGFIERLAYETADHTAAVTLGTVSGESLGHGVLVDHYQSTLDPLRPHTGGRFDLNVGDVSAGVLCGSLTAPHLVATSLLLAPLAGTAVDPDRRLHLGIEGGLDPSAPAGSGRRPMGGGSLDLGYTLVRGDHVTVETYGAAVLLSTLAAGTHTGLRLEVGQDPATVTGRLEAVWSGHDYTPGYFDIAYEAERLSDPESGRPAKADLRHPKGLGARARLEARAAMLRFGAGAAIRERDAPLALSAYVAITSERLSLAAMWSQRSLARFADLGRIGRTGAALVDLSVNVVDNLFLFGQARRSLRGDGPRRQPVFDWVGGLGLGLASAEAGG